MSTELLSVAALAILRFLVGHRDVLPGLVAQSLRQVALLLRIAVVLLKRRLPITRRVARHCAAPIGRN